MRHLSRDLILKDGEGLQGSRQGQVLRQGLVKFILVQRQGQKVPAIVIFVVSIIIIVIIIIIIIIVIIIITIIIMRMPPTMPL